MWMSCLSPLCQLSALWPRRRTASRRSCRWPSGASCRFPFDTGNKHTLMTYFWIYTITSSNEVYSFSRLFPYEKPQTANKLTGASAVLVCRNPFDLFFVCKNVRRVTFSPWGRPCLRWGRAQGSSLPCRLPSPPQSPSSPARSSWQRSGASNSAGGENVNFHLSIVQKCC